MARTGTQLVVALIAAACLFGWSCRSTEPPPPSPSTKADADPFAAARRRMVEEQIRARGIDNPAVLEAMATVPRHHFVPDRARELAYIDRPLPIENQQTISQPYIVALMTELAQVAPGSKVLEVGTGSGYQAAIMADIGAEVYSIEIIGALAQSARRTLASLGYAKVQVRHGDGYRGWPEQAPFDAILVTAAPPRIPEALLEQLAVGARLVIPVGKRSQELLLIERSPTGYTERSVLPVRFVPMTDQLR